MTHDEEGNPIRQSRWVKKSNVPRYNKEQRKLLDEMNLREPDGWHRGARVRAS